MFSTFSQMEKNKSLVYVFVCVRQEKNQYECFFSLSFPDGKKKFSKLVFVHFHRWKRQRSDSNETEPVQCT